jgi:hypothetical protein
VLPEDHLIFRVIMTSIGYHILLVISYFIWYGLQRRYTEKHYKDEDADADRDSIASGLGAFDPRPSGLGAFDPRPSGPGDEVPLSPR